MTQVVFITDGAVSNEAELLTYIDQQIAARRLFTIGIGSAPNTHFMAEAANFGRGTHTYIAQIDTINERLQILFEKLEHPALTDIQLQVPAEAEILPDPIPDLYHGEPLIAVMQVPDVVEDIDISGRIGSMQWNTRLTPKAANNSSTTDGLGIYWARQKIQYWMRSLVRGKEPQQVRQKVTELALEHHLVSQYTSLVAVDVTPVRPVSETLEQHALKGNLPAGWKPSNQARTQAAPAGLVLAQGATGSWLSILAGLLLLCLAAVLALLSTRKNLKAAV
jgi:Ca-activated chloride channel family protein